MSPSNTGHAHWSAPGPSRCLPGRNRSPKPANWTVDMKNTLTSAKPCLKEDSHAKIPSCASVDNEQTVLLVIIAMIMIQSRHHHRVLRWLVQINTHVQYCDLTRSCTLCCCHVKFMLPFDKINHFTFHLFLG